MALRNFIENGVLTSEEFHITNKFRLREANSDVFHILNPDDDSYTISNRNANLLKFNNVGNLQDCKVKEYILNHTNPLFNITTDHETRLSSVEGTTNPYTEITGTSANDTIFNAGSVAIASNKVGYITGKCVSKSSYFNFEIYCKNTAGTLVITSWNLDSYYVLSNETMAFEVSSQNIIIKVKNTNSTTNWKLEYNTEFINL